MRIACNCVTCGTIGLAQRIFADYRRRPLARPTAGTSAAERRWARLEREYAELRRR